MPVAYQTPGVYREEIFLRPQASVLTGVPGFIGWFDPKDSDLETPFNFPIPLHHKEEFTDSFASGSAGAYLTAAVTGFFENGGVRCYVIRASEDTDLERSLTTAIDALASFDDFDLLAIPDLMGIARPQMIYRVQQAMIDHCTQQGDRLAILDAIGNSTIDDVMTQRQTVTRNRSEPLNAALYYPWLKNAQGRLVPPCGHIAGIFSRSDRTYGVSRAPANEAIRDVVDLAVALDNAAQDRLNPEGINCLRAFPGRGIRVWGARTLNRDRNWRYVNIRRLFLTISRWIEENMQWASFEPNSFQLWVRIQRELGGYLQQLFQAGALQGQTPEQAFYVKCDVETNPPEIREQGRTIAEIGIAANAPAEFIVVRIIQQPGTTEINVEPNR